MIKAATPDAISDLFISFSSVCSSAGFLFGRPDGHRYTPKSAECGNVFPASHASSSGEHQLTESAVARVRGWTISLERSVCQTGGQQVIELISKSLGRGARFIPPEPLDRRALFAAPSMNARIGAGHFDALP
jgi:hypothetical protein